MYDYGELRLQGEWSGRNPRNGRFLPGHTPKNKGKTWSEWVGKRAQKRMAKGWKNLDIVRYKPRDRSKCGRKRKGVIAINQEGRWTQFESITLAGKQLNMVRENIRRACQLNHLHRPSRNGVENDQHQYGGFLFYYETDTALWTTKINKEFKASPWTKYNKGQTEQ